MVASHKSFYVSLYEEHLGASSVLLDQIAAYRHDPELGWEDVANWESRLARHLDALATGNEHVAAVCGRKLATGDAGERDAALRVLLLQGRKEAVYAALRDLDTQDAETAAAFATALAAVTPAGWVEELATVAERHTRLAPVLAPLFARRRASVAAALLQALEGAQAEAQVPLLRALGRVAGADTGTRLERYWRGSGDAATPAADAADAATAAVAATAADAALRAGHAPAASELALLVTLKPELALPLALGGPRSATAALADLARNGHATADVLLALGLLGDLGSVRTIFDCLGSEELAPSAALALELVTGAGLDTEVFVPSAIDPDELFDEERVRYEATGEVPKRADGEPYGARVVQLSTDAASWKDWLSRNKARFDPALRYRCGEPYAPRALKRALEMPRLPNRVRALVCDELRIRYGLDFPLEIDLPVAEQRRLLARLGEWVERDGARFEAGRWYFHGRPQA
jgi:hypothetical protein